MAKLEALFDKAKIGSMELRNRICLGEIIAQAYPDGNMSDATIDFYVERARGGVGLIMVGAAVSDFNGIASKYQGRLDDDKYIPRLSEMARRIHEASPEVKVGIQVLHAGRQSHTHAKGAMPGVRLVAPSPIKCRGCEAPHELTTEEVEFQVRQFVEAARRLKEAGFDCVGLHGAHGYLISQFISPYSNKRTDKYGGSIENRARFACEIIEGIKKTCGNDFPVLIKINCKDGVDPSEYPLAKEQITVEHTVAVAPLLEKAGADEVHVSASQYESRDPIGVSPYMIPRGCNADCSAEVKKVVKIPVGVINSINDPLLAEQILEKGKADLIWMARPLIADPELPNKAAEGKLDEIRTCIRCSTCIDILWNEWYIDTRCAINPEAWREKQFGIVRTLRPKKVLVIGGGPAGLEAARVASLIGHEVILWEKSDKLGGQANLATIAPYKDEFSNLIRYFSVQMKKLDVKVELGKEATPALVEKLKPDVIVVATGSTTLFPPIPGADRSIVVDARDVLTGKAEVGNKVVVIGGGEVGMETAQVLAEKGKRITMVVRTKMGKGMVQMVYFWMRSELAKHGVEMLPNTKTEEITDSGVVVVDVEQKRRTIEADTVVMAAGARPETALHKALEDIAPEIHLAGDCLYPGDIRSAIYHGAAVARMLDDPR